MIEVPPGWTMHIVEDSVLAGIGETHPERLKVISIDEAETTPFQDWHELPRPFRNTLPARYSYLCP